MYRAGQEEVDEVTKVILSKEWFLVGDPADGHQQEVAQFEREWAEKIGVAHALILTSGTAGLVCALAALEIGPGDEVIVPAYTWMATATAVLSVGAIPVLAEVDESLGLDPQDFERKIGPATRAVIPVHMSGRPADLESILAVAAKHGVKVIEDCCQMDGGSYKGRRTGAWGDVGVFSFNYFKIISSGGEGGCLVTNDSKLHERAMIYHDSGSVFRPSAQGLSEPVYVAQQYRVGEVTAALARIQMQRMDDIIADLRRNRDALAVAIKDADGVVEAPSNDPSGDCGVMLTLQFKDEKAARAFATASGVDGVVLIDHGKHVFTEWTPLREKRSGHHPDMNPFNFAKNQGLRMDYSEAACPRTLEILRRTVYVNVNPDWTEQELSAKQTALRQAVQEATS